MELWTSQGMGEIMPNVDICR